MTRVLQVPRNAFVEAEIEQSALLIDARITTRPCIVRWSRQEATS